MLYYWPDLLAYQEEATIYWGGGLKDLHALPYTCSY